MRNKNFYFIPLSLVAALLLIGCKRSAAHATEIVLVSSQTGVVIAADKRAGQVGNLNVFNDSAKKVIEANGAIISGCGTTVFSGIALSKDGSKRNVEIFNAIQTGKSLIEALPFKDISNKAAAKWLGERTATLFAQKFQNCHEPLQVASIDPIFAVCWLKPNTAGTEIDCVIAQVRANHRSEAHREFSVSSSSLKFFKNKFDRLLLGATSVTKNADTARITTPLSETAAIAFARNELKTTFEKVKVNGRSITSSVADICIMRPDGHIQWIGKNVSISR